MNVHDRADLGPVPEIVGILLGKADTAMAGRNAEWRVDLPVIVVNCLTVTRDVLGPENVREVIGNGNRHIKRCAGHGFVGNAAQNRMDSGRGFPTRSAGGRYRPVDRLAAIICGNDLRRQVNIDPVPWEGLRSRRRRARLGLCQLVGVEILTLSDLAPGVRHSHDSLTAYLLDDSNGLAGLKRSNNRGTRRRCTPNVWIVSGYNALPAVGRIASVRQRQTCRNGED